MKTKLLIGASILFLFTACIDDFINDHPNNDDDVKFTAKNHINETRLYNQFLLVETNTAKLRIAEIDSSELDSTLLNERAVLIERLDYLGNESLAIAPQISEILFRKPIPCPEEDVAFDLCYPDLDKLVYVLDSNVSKFIINTENQETIFDFNKSSFIPVPELEGIAEYQNFETDITGRLFISVEREDSLGNRIGYTAFIQK